MTISQNVINIRPEDGWVSVGTAPIVFGIYPTLKHRWFVAFGATTPANDYAAEISMPYCELKPFLSKEYSGLLASTDQVWVRIKEPPNSDNLTKLTFKVLVAR